VSDDFPLDLRLLSAALNATLDGIIITDAAGVITWVNSAATRCAGYSREELVGQSIELLRSDQPSSDRPWSGELISWRKDGTLCTEATTTTPIKNDAGIITHYISVRRDITKERELQAQRLHAEKMDVVGRLAGNIANDFNNLLGVINGTADLAAMSVERDSALRADLETIRQTGERAAMLTRQLLAFGRKQIPAPQVLDLNRVIVDLTSMLQRHVGDTTTVVVTPLARQPLVHADAGQLEQVVLNLVVNARDAMPSGGTITIATHDAASAVTLTVSDTGKGIDAAIRPHIFEPFFTTKDSGRGTGLGLSTVRSIVESNGGRIDVESHVGLGTTFTVAWPRCDASAPAEPAVSGQVMAPATVMVVDDDADIRRLTERILRDAGYGVCSAGSAEDALLLVGRLQEADLLLADVVLPGLRGVELADRMVAAKPSLKVMYMSGYSDRGLSAVELKAVEGQLLRKPFTAAQLVAMVRTALGAPEPKPRG